MRRVGSINRLMQIISVFILQYPFFSSIIIDKIGLHFWGNVDEIAMLLLVMLILVLREGRIVLNRSMRIYVLLLFLWVVVGLIPVFFSEVPILVGFQGAFFQIKNYLLFLLVFSVKWDREQIDWLLFFLKSFYPIIIFLGFVFYFVPALRLFPSDEMSSIYNHPGVFATLIVPVAIYSFVMYINKGKVRHLVILGIIFICLLLAGTIRNISSVFVVFGLYLLYVKKKRKYLFIFIAIAGILFVLPQLIDIFREEIYTNILSATAGKRPRWMLWWTSFKIFRDYMPLGTGFGTFASSPSYANGYYSFVYKKYGLASRFGFRKGEEYFLQDTYWPAVIGETGLLGTIIAVSCIIVILAFAFRTIKENKTLDDNNEFGAIAFLVFAALIVESLFTATMFGIRSYFGICVLAIYCSYIRESDQRKSIE